MQRHTLHTQAIQFSQHIFVYLLRLYPREYRQAYGAHMAQLFADCSREAAQHNNPAALLELWASTLLDICKTALEERIKEVGKMNGEQSQRRASLLLLAGAAILLIVIASGRFELTYNDPLGGPDGWIEYTRLVGMPLSYLLLAAGAWQLHKATNFATELAKSILALSTLAAVMSLLGFAALKITGINNFGLLEHYSQLVFLVGLGGFGLALRSKLPSASSLLMLGGFLLPVLFMIGLVSRKLWWLRGDYVLGFTAHAWVDLLNVSYLIAPALLCLAAILLLRNRSAAHG